MDGATPKNEGQDPTEAARQAVDHALAALDKLDDQRRRFALAGALEHYLSEQAERAAAIRARAVLRIYEDEQATLAELAQRIGVTRGRAHQLINRARGGDKHA